MVVAQLFVKVLTPNGTMILYLLLLLLENSHSRVIIDKDLCKNIECNDTTPVCGIRPEGEGFRLKVFDNECRLLENGCLVDDDEAYGIINMEYCENSFKTNLIEESSAKSCSELECPVDDREVCALRTDDDGFRLRIFENKCQLWKYNCENNTNFVETDLYMCNDLNTTSNNKETEEFYKEEFDKKILKLENIVIVDNMINFNNVNESIDKFFAATHVFDLPMQDVTKDFPDISGRRMRVRNAGPVKVFKPWTTIPKNISTDIWHIPTLSSCYHKCPTKCPDTYAPVCGVPGNLAREPNLTFKNHCFMDAAQCKMKWEDKSSTAYSSFYIESSFLFCLGEEMNGMFRFLPLIRTLQHMGRLKKKGHFRYKLKNLKFFNNFLREGDPNFMG